MRFMVWWRLHYSGRAAAQIKPMLRLIVTKPDGVLMIHEGRREKPIIWNPPGSQLFVSVVNGELTLRSIRHSQGNTLL